MGYTNKTSHYDLPQWIAGDKPSWLGDVNTAMLNIDTAIAGADASATAAESSAAAAAAHSEIYHMKRSLRLKKSPAIYPPNRRQRLQVNVN